MFAKKKSEAIALRIPEILELVIDHLARPEDVIENLARGENDGFSIYSIWDRPNLHSAALVNTLWYDIAIDRLWAVCPAHIFFDLPATRQQFYAGKIRCLRSEKTEGVRDPELQKKPKLVDISFPRLEAIDLLGDDCDNMEQFIQPSLKIVRMGDVLHDLSGWADSCGQHCTNVESLILALSKSPQSALITTNLLAMVQSVRRLTSLHIRGARVDIDLLVYLFKGSAIQDLTVSSFVTSDELKRIYQAPLDVVPCMKRLEIVIRAGLEYLVPVVASTLTILDISNSEQTDEFFSLLPTIKGLRELSARFEGSRLTGTAFSAIARLVNLKKLEVRSYRFLEEKKIDVTEQEFVTSISQLQQLRHVDFYQFRTNFSFAVLASIGLKCRLLEFFNVQMQHELTSSAAVICDNQDVLLPNLTFLFLEFTSPADLLPKKQIFPKKRLIPMTHVDQSAPKRTPFSSPSNRQRAAARPMLDFLVIHAPKLKNIHYDHYTDLNWTIDQDFRKTKRKTAEKPQKWDAEWNWYLRRRQLESYRGQVKSLSDKWKKMVLPGT